MSEKAKNKQSGGTSTIKKTLTSQTERFDLLHHSCFFIIINVLTEAIS